MKFNLSNFLFEVYNIDLEQVTAFENFYFEEVSGKDIYEFDSYIEKFIKTNPEYKDLNYIDFVNAANTRYENSYISDYYSLFIEELEKKVRKDIVNICKFYIDTQDELNIKEIIEVNKFDVMNNIISFKGKNEVDDFASIIINCINGYGTFHYDNLEDFYYVNSVKTMSDKIDTVEGHLHWLKYFEEIYGTMYNIFKKDFSDLDRNNSLGDYDFTIDDLEYTL